MMLTHTRQNATVRSGSRCVNRSTAFEKLARWTCLALVVVSVSWHAVMDCSAETLGNNRPPADNQVVFSRTVDKPWIILPGHGSPHMADCWIQPQSHLPAGDNSSITLASATEHNSETSDQPTITLVNQSSQPRAVTNLLFERPLDQSLANQFADSADQQPMIVFDCTANPWINSKTDPPPTDNSLDLKPVGSQIANALGSSSDLELIGLAQYRQSQIFAEPRRLLQHAPQHYSDSSCTAGHCVWNDHADADSCTGTCTDCCSEFGCTGEVQFLTRRSPQTELCHWQYELSPGERLWPRRWPLAASVDPWPRVFRAEQTPGYTQYHGSLHCEPYIDDRAHQAGELNPVRLLEDLPVAQMRPDVTPPSGRMPQMRSPQANPEQLAVAHLGATERGWDASNMHWNASNATHAPLYFEEVSLERAGYSRGYWQPLFSGVQFFSTVPLLPGLMTAAPPTSTQFELGEDRPGSAVPYSRRRQHWTAKAVVVEAGAVLGLSFLIP